MTLKKTEVKKIFLLQPISLTKLIDLRDVSYSYPGSTILTLKNINIQFGIELDLRDDHKTGKIILSHDPFLDGEYFEDYLKEYNHNTLILNIKYERIEIDCLKLLEKYNISNYFFLDSSFPMIYLLHKTYKNNKIACRFSEFENIKNFLDINFTSIFLYLLI
jgi:hypothetical protein